MPDTARRPNISWLTPYKEGGLHFAHLLIFCLFTYLRICLFAYLLIASALNHSLFVTFLSPHLFSSNLLGFNISLFACQASVCLNGRNKSTQYLVDFICSQLGQGSWYIWDLVQEKYIVLEDTKPRAKRNYTVSTKTQTLSHICFAKKEVLWQNFIFIPGTQVLVSCLTRWSLYWKLALCVSASYQQRDRVQQCTTQVSKVSNAIPNFLSPSLKHLPWGVKNSNWASSNKTSRLQVDKLTYWIINFWYSLLTRLFSLGCWSWLKPWCASDNSICLKPAMSDLLPTVETSGQFCKTNDPRPIFSAC